METSGMKRVMGMLMVLMLVVVAAQGQAAVTDVHPDANIFKCAVKCGLRCARELLPLLVKLCFRLCMKECEHQPSKAVFNCTSACAKSAVDSNPRADVKMVNAYVDSCYESCKN